MLPDFYLNTEGSHLTQNINIQFSFCSDVRFKDQKHSLRKNRSQRVLAFEIQPQCEIRVVALSKTFTTYLLNMPERIVVGFSLSERFRSLSLTMTFLLTIKH